MSQLAATADTTSYAQLPVKLEQLLQRNGDDDTAGSLPLTAAVNNNEDADLPTDSASAAAAAAASKAAAGDTDLSDDQSSVENTATNPGPLRARLCLETNSSACGPYVVGVVVDVLDLGGQPWLVALIVVVTLLGLVALLVAVKCVCHSRRKKSTAGGAAKARNGGTNGAGGMIGTVGGSVLGTNGRPSKMLHPMSLHASSATSHHLHSQNTTDAYNKAHMFAITGAGENQHGQSGYDLTRPDLHHHQQHLQGEPGGCSNSQSDSANSTEPLWAYQKSPCSDGMDLHYPAAALAGKVTEYIMFQTVEKTQSS